MNAEEESKMALLEKSGPEASSSASKYEQRYSALLPNPEISSSSYAMRITWTQLRLGSVICLGVLVVAAVIALISDPVFVGGGGKVSHGQQQNWGKARAQLKLDKPVLIVISADGFRWGFNYKVPTPNIDRLRVSGTEAEYGLIPVYPSLTYPSHYSIATGLYPAWHGIIQNHFHNPYDPSAKGFSEGSSDPKWWLGEPIWVTVTNNGLKAASDFWPGSAVTKDSWTCPSKFCMPYNKSYPYEDRVDRALNFLKLPAEDVPSYIGLYFESPDAEGHKWGTDAPQVSEGVAEVDKMIGRLITGLEGMGVFEDVTIILLGDHGMVSLCTGRTIYLEDFKHWIDIDVNWVDYDGTLLALRPPPGVDVQNIYCKLQEALASDKVKNSEFLKLYLKKNLPERFKLSSSDRVAPIFGLVAEGYKIAHNRSGEKHICGGGHGYDNELLSMRSIFIAHGPKFARGRKVPSFINVELYNMFTSVLDLKKAAPNNGTDGFAKSLLLPSG